MRIRRTLAIVLLAVVAFAAVPMTGCSVSGPELGGDVVGRWQPKSFADSAANAVPGTFIEFGGDGRASGFAGVNSFAGPYATKDDGTIEIGPLAVTKMAGPPAAMTGEQAFLAVLDKAAFYSAKDGVLTLLDADKKPLGELEPAKTVALTGTEWAMTGHNNGKEAVVTSEISGNVTAKFGEDGKLIGKSGCGTYEATYTAQGETISISKLEGTKTAPCPVDYADQRSQYFAAMPKAATYSISTRGGAGGAVPTLEIRDASGALLASFETTNAPK